MVSNLYFSIPSRETQETPDEAAETDEVGKLQACAVPSINSHVLMLLLNNFDYSFDWQTSRWRNYIDCWQHSIQMFQQVVTDNFCSNNLSKVGVSAM